MSPPQTNIGELHHHTSTLPPCPSSLKLALTSAAKACHLHGGRRPSAQPSYLLRAGKTGIISHPTAAMIISSTRGSNSEATQSCCEGSACKGKKGSLIPIRSLSSWNRSKERLDVSQQRMKRAASSSSSSSSLAIVSNGSSGTTRALYNSKWCRILRKISGRSRGKGTVVKEQEEGWGSSARRAATVYIVHNDNNVGRKQEEEEDVRKEGEDGSVTKRKERAKLECGLGLLLCMLLISISNNYSVTYFLSVPLLTCWWYAAAHRRRSRPISTSLSPPPFRLKLQAPHFLHRLETLYKMCAIQLKQTHGIHLRLLAFPIPPLEGIVMCP